MRIVLVYNPTAGGGIDVEALVGLLEDSGHQVRKTNDRHGWTRLLRSRPADLAVAAGGDGTVRDVALGSADRGVPFAVLPLGTANNIGKALGLAGDARAMISAWEVAAARPFDLGVVSAGPAGRGAGGGPAGREPDGGSGGSGGSRVARAPARFVESFGGGLFADLLAEAWQLVESGAMVGRAIDRALHLLDENAAAAQPVAWRLSVDGDAHDGDYLAVEVMNIRFAGPNVPLAPVADPGDGWLDVVTVRADDRAALRAHLRGRLGLASGAAPALPVIRGRSIRLAPPAGVRFHLDDELWSAGQASEVTVRVAPAAASIVLRPPLAHRLKPRRHRSG